MLYPVLVSENEENWWFEVEAASLEEASLAAMTKLVGMNLWTTTCKVKVLEVLDSLLVSHKPQEQQKYHPQQADTSTYILAADGACKDNPGPGGWSALLLKDGRTQIRSGGEDVTTNNRMELTAVIQGLFMLPGPSKVKILVDSRYVMDGFVKGWLQNWKRNGWKAADKKPVKNQDLWEQLERQVLQHEVSWEWVKGHSGHPLNEQVDAEASRQANNRKGAL